MDELARSFRDALGLPSWNRYVEGAIREGVEDSGWEILMRQVALGSKKWIDTIRKTLKGHREQPESRSLQVRVKFNETQRQLGEASGGADYAAVSAAIKSMDEKLSRDKGLQRRLAGAKTNLHI